MKLTTTKTAFASALSAVSSVVKTRNSLPVLSFARMDAMATGIAITATDLDSHYMRAAEARVDQSGSCLLPVARVKEWLGIVGNGDVMVESDGKTLKLSMQDTGAIKFATYPVEEFPPMPKHEQKKIATLDFAPLKQIAWSVADDALYRPALCAAFIEPEGDGIIAVTTDGRKCGTVKIEAEVKDKAFAPPSLPSDYIPLVAALGPCEFSESKNSLHFKSPSFSLDVRKSTEGFPPWRNAITGHPHIGSCSVIREELASAIAQCHVHRGGEPGSWNGVRVQLEPAEGGMKISCLTEKTGASYTGTIAGKIVGEFPPMILSTEHLLPFFSLPDDSLLKIDFTGSNTFVHMNAGDVDYWWAPCHYSKEKV